MIYLYYNSKANNSKQMDELLPKKEELEKSFNQVISLTPIEQFNNEQIKDFKKGDIAIISGGDGTLNYLINHIDFTNFPIDIYLLPLGTGNDFFTDQEEYKKDNGLILLNDKLINLPIVEVKGKTYKFINGIGFGIDGECCVKAEQLKNQGAKEINYSKITIKLLGKFVPRKAKVIVDGEEFNFKKVFLASTMKGKYYGGGMKIAPSQDRKNDTVSFVTIFGQGRLKTLMLFPKIFSGKHVNNKHTFIKQGKIIEVIFDKPCGLQIDGEVVEDVTSYKVIA